MKPLFTRSENSLTTDFLVDYYIEVYEALHDEKPECQHVQGPYFLVNGVQRDRKWLLLEAEMLCQQLIAKKLTGDSSLRRLLHILRIGNT